MNNRALEVEMFAKENPVDFVSNEQVWVLPSGLAGALYYIKRKGESSGLSLLFTQGLTAALTLLTDVRYRRRFREIIDSIARKGIENHDDGELLAQEYCARAPNNGPTAACGRQTLMYGRSANSPPNRALWPKCESF